jgi:hypothetical protein
MEKWAMVLLPASLPGSAQAQKHEWPGCGPAKRGTHEENHQKMKNGYG